MLIRHCVKKSNVDEQGRVLDASKIIHATIKSGKLESMSGLIDPASHLNLDYRDHKVTRCVIAEDFCIGANVLFSEQGLLFATVDPASYGHYGPVDYTQRLADMIEAVKRKKKKKKKSS
jgi:hypothetical protein